MSLLALVKEHDPSVNECISLRQPALGLRADKAPNGNWDISLRISTTITQYRLLIGAASLGLAAATATFIGTKLAISLLVIAAKVLAFASIALTSTVLAASFGAIAAVSALSGAGMAYIYSSVVLTGSPALGFLVLAAAAGLSGVHIGSEIGRLGVNGSPRTPPPASPWPKIGLAAATAAAVSASAYVGYAGWNETVALLKHHTCSILCGAAQA